MLVFVVGFSNAWSLAMVTDIIDCPIHTPSRESSTQSSIQPDKVKIFVSTATNTRGGWDSDLAIYDSDAQFRNYQIATCTQSLFSMYGTDMVKLTESEKELLSQWYPSYQQNLPSAKNILTWQRYNIAADVYRKLDYDSAFLAELYMNGSWTIRDDMVGVHRIEGPSEMQKLLKEGDKELSKQLTLEQRKLVIYNLARVAHRFGDDALSLSYIQKFEDIPNLSDQEQHVVRQFRQGIIWEKEMQQKALIEIGKIPKEKKNLIHILWEAEILRKQGRWEEALVLYKKLSTQTEYPQIQKIAIFFTTWEPN